jgi:hypothetical protein
MLHNSLSSSHGFMQVMKIASKMINLICSSKSINKKKKSSIIQNVCIQTIWDVHSTPTS